MILTIHVKPNARQTRIIAWKDAETVIIALTAPPVDGKANQALIKFLAKKLHIAKSLVEIKRGQGGRVKHIKLPDSAVLDPLRDLNSESP